MKSTADVTGIEYKAREVTKDSRNDSRARWYTGAESSAMTKSLD